MPDHVRFWPYSRAYHVMQLFFVAVVDQLEQVTLGVSLKHCWRAKKGKHILEDRVIGIQGKRTSS